MMARAMQRGCLFCHQRTGMRGSDVVPQDAALPAVPGPNPQFWCRNSCAWTGSQEEGRAPALRGQVACALPQARALPGTLPRAWQGHLARHLCCGLQHDCTGCLQLRREAGSGKPACTPESLGQVEERTGCSCTRAAAPRGRPGRHLRLIRVGTRRARRWQRPPKRTSAWKGSVDGGCRHRL